jgi:hypothetical protein
MVYLMRHQRRDIPRPPATMVGIGQSPVKSWEDALERLAKEKLT